MKSEPVIYTGFILLICIFSTGLSRGETAIDALFQAAVEQVGKVSRKESIVAFEEIISRDADYAPAYNELAKLHLLYYSVNGRQRARQIIQKAIEQDYKNPAYQLTRAKIMWSQGFWEEALNQYKTVVKHHPKNTEALDGIGMALVYEYLSMRDAVKTRDRDFSGFAAKANREAEQVLLKSIQLNPANQKPYYLLGMLYFESQHFTDFQDLMRRLKMHYPTDKNVLLFCGLAEYEVGEFNSAHQFYSKALEQMSLDERELMESIDLLKPQEDPDIPVVQLSQDNISQFDELRSRNNFWKSQDPLYLSEFNERKMEHFGRMAYANLRFRRFSDDNEEQFLYDQETFHLSDLLVASDIQARNAFPEHRDDLIITPNPVRTFSQSESIFIYLEIYNLQRDNFERTHYQISYTISKPEVDTVSPELFMSQKVLDTLGKTEINRGLVHHTEARDLKIERAQSDVIRTVTANYEGTRENGFTYLQIDVNQIPEGIYQLTVLAKDKQTEQTDMQHVYFRIVE